MKITNHTIQGVSFLVLAMLTFSLQNIAVKWIGGDYSVMEIVAFRSLIAIPCTLLLFRFEGGRGLPTTQRHKLELLRGGFLFLSYTSHFMGLAALPLADIESIRFSAPLMITFLSVVLLGEKVGPHRWFALLIGFLGILFIIRPGSATFNIGSIFTLTSVLFYALSIMVTRKLKTTESSATMAYYSSLAYVIGISILAPLTIFFGEVPNAHPSIAFLFRAWTIPTLLDWAIMSGLGLVWASGMYLMARAYSAVQASVAAPFEYLSLPINVMWGFLIWHEVPTWATLFGAFLTLFSGLYVLYREQKRRAAKVVQV